MRWWWWLWLWLRLYDRLLLQLALLAVVVVAGDDFARDAARRVIRVIRVRWRIVWSRVRCTYRRWPVAVPIRAGMRVVPVVVSVPAIPAISTVSATPKRSSAGVWLAGCHVPRWAPRRSPSTGVVVSPAWARSVERPPVTTAAVAASVVSTSIAISASAAVAASVASCAVSDHLISHLPTHLYPLS